VFCCVHFQAKAAFGDIDTSEGRRLRKRSTDPPKVEEKRQTPKRTSRVYQMIQLLLQSDVYKAALQEKTHHWRFQSKPVKFL